MVAEYAYCALVMTVLAVRLCLQRRIAILHICMPPPVLFPLGRLMQALGRTVVVDYRDLIPELFQARYSSRRLGRLVRRAERLALEYADHVIVTNDTAASAVLERCHVDPDRLTVIRSGPELGVLPAVTSTCRPDGILVGYVGKMAPQDGIENVVRAAARVRIACGRQDISFVCVGTGSELDPARRLTAELRLTETIEFTGQLEHSEALARLAACDVCIQPDPKNAFNDSCTMIKTLEYMAVGKPVVAFDLVETRTSCGTAALYATGGSAEELGDLIVGLADDPSLRGRLGSEGRRRIEGGLAWSFGERRLLDVYRRLGPGTSLR